MTKFSDLMRPSVDYVFCRLFGSEKNKDRLISLLNSILNGKPFIKDVDIDPTEYKKTYRNGKAIRLDIKATTDDGTIINVEMQCIDTKYVIYRAELYQAMMLQDLYMQSGDNYKNIPNRISIWICKSDAIDRPGCIHEALLMYKATKLAPIEVASSKYRCIIIELSKLDKYEAEDVGNMFKTWMDFVNDPKKLSTNELSIKEVDKAIKDLEYLSHDKTARADYIYRMKEINDMINAKSEGIEIGREEGLKEGKEEGLKEGERIGEAKGKIEMAKKMLLDGMSIDIILKYSGLSVEEIEKLK